MGLVSIFPKHLGEVFALSLPTEEGGSVAPGSRVYRIGGGGITWNLLREGMPLFSPGAALPSTRVEPALGQRARQDAAT